MKNIRRAGMGAAGIAAISTAIALAAPSAVATTGNDCPPTTTPPTTTTTSPSTIGTGSASWMGSLLNNLLKGLGSGLPGASSSGAGAAVS
ncbi:hypothetical protein GL305_07800 [Nocardia seriolae]|uniref:hypothetical protein n=1 Tax=Nocardia seriolae TaxID=37332 RepID=UPI0012BC7153|nr:hypothetical protein [Nocardia seriolae]MTJ85926.1 hypothetical protein [Nocardia seriolae]MTK29920.1 hypothetical protein [Nocardia seriolae]MTK44153.1 hypothetical protein [Nocardia seriolae]